MLIFISMLLLLIASSPLAADEDPYGDPHYNLYRTWALAPSSAENPFKIIAFLPEGYLFHVLQRDAETVSGSRYSLALTQDAVEVLIYTDSISDQPFRQAVGDHELIFNSRYQLCKNAFCLKSAENSWSIARSEAFKIIDEKTVKKDPVELVSENNNSDSAVKIRATRGWQRVEGYLSKFELAELTATGLVTRTDQLLPRYSINKRKSEALSTQCGQQRRPGDVLSLPIDDSISLRLADLLAMGAAASDRGDDSDDNSDTDGNTEIEISQTYGGPETLYSFYLYEIEDRTADKDSSDRFFEAAAGFKISCSTNRVAAGGYSKDYIDHLLFANSRNRINDKPLLVDIPSQLFNTPRDIRQYTADAYMISINKPEHFEQSIEILANKIGDRTLAGYMLTELNRSCRSALRTQYSGSVCRIYDY